MLQNSKKSCSPCCNAMIDFHAFLTTDLNGLAAQGVRHAALTPSAPLKNQEDCAASEFEFAKVMEGAPPSVRCTYAPAFSFYPSPERRLSGLPHLSGTDCVLFLLPETLPEDMSVRITAWRRVGVTPVFLDVLSCKSLRDRPQLLYELAAMGCLFEVDASSLLGETQSLALAMFKHGLFHFYGSGRTPEGYLAGIQLLEARFGREKVGALQANMARILAGKKPELPRPAKLHRLFGKYV